VVRHEKGLGVASGLLWAMAVPAARGWRVAGVPKPPTLRCSALVGVYGSLQSPAREGRYASHLPLAQPSGSYPRLDRQRRTLTIPISTAVEALQSNEVYLPRMHQWQDRTLSARQINAIR